MFCVIKRTSHCSIVQCPTWNNLGSENRVRVLWGFPQKTRIIRILEQSCPLWQPLPSEFKLSQHYKRLQGRPKIGFQPAFSKLQRLPRNWLQNNPVSEAKANFSELFTQFLLHLSRLSSNRQVAYTWYLNMDLFIHKSKAQCSDLPWIGQRPPSIHAHSRWPYDAQWNQKGIFCSRGDLEILPGPALSRISVFTGSSSTVWSSGHSMVLKHHRRGPFCHLNLCNKILLTEWLILEGRWLKYLTRETGFPEIMLHGSGQLQPATLSQGIRRLKTEVFHSHWEFCS